MKGTARRPSAFVGAASALIAAALAFAFTVAICRAEEPSSAGPSAHAKAQVARLHEVKTLVDAGRDGEANALVAAAREQSASLARNDPQRIDADEMEVALLAAEQRFADARRLSERVVEARRNGPAGEQLLLCWALLLHTIILDGAGDGVAADKALLESIRAARNVFPAFDVRRPQMLEAYADLLARGYNRPLAGIALYEAAIEMREAMPQSPRADLAEALRKLALIEPAQGRDLAADAHLDRSVHLLEAEMSTAATDAARTETSGDIATLLGMRIGLAARAQHFDDARRLLALARERAAGTPSAPFMDLYAADADRREAEFKGDPAAALLAVRRGIAHARNLQQGGSPELIASLELVEARLQIELGDIDDGAATIDHALKAFAQSPHPEGARTAEGWLLLARIERARGNDVRAARWVTGALAMLKTRRSEVEVLFATNRAPRERETRMFGGEIGSELKFGRALVLVPRAPPLPGAGLSTLGGPTDLERLLLSDIGTLQPAEFAAAARSRAAAAKLYPKSALLFVHGFATTFEYALGRAAQISRDIAYDGPTFLFTWPSQGKPDPASYSADEKSANASVDRLVETIHTIQEITGAERIHIVAHSMGNQVLIKALGKLREPRPAGAGDVHLGEIVFASPDVDQGEFQERAAQLDGLGMTLYASAYDKALWLSLIRNRGARAGTVLSGLLSGGHPVLARGVDSIDVSEAGRDYFSFNHDVYVSSPHVANDLRRLVQFGEHPPARRSADVLIEEGRGPERYWRFRAPLPGKP